MLLGTLKTSHSENIALSVGPPFSHHQLVVTGEDRNISPPADQQLSPHYQSVCQSPTLVFIKRKRLS